MPQKTISRNAPCPCGSGKKYKLCCLKKEPNNKSDPLWRQLRQVEEKLIAQIFQYVQITFGDEVFYEAWDEFISYRDDKPFEFDSPQNPAFFPWFLFNWRPIDWEAEDENGLDEHEVPTIAESFLKRHRRRLSDMERRFMELSCAKEFSFHEIVECQPGIGFTLRDIFLENEVYVTERSASQVAQRADILFAKVIEYGNVGLLAGCGPVAIPPRYKPGIIDLRALMRLQRDKLGEVELVEWNDAIRGHYLEIYDAIHTPPVLCNTDGDLLSFHDMTFEISSGSIAFEKLKSLALDTPEDELLEDAEFDSENNLQKVEFRWIKKSKSKKPFGDYTTLGHIIIEDKKLTASVNSAKRATKLRREIEKRLRKHVRHLATEVKAIEEIKADAEDTPTEKHAPEMSPELEAAMDQSFAAHWQQWIDEKIPALGGITPRHAVEDKDGREKINALLDDFERQEKRDHGGFNQLKYIQQVRRQLGLD